MSGVMAFSFGVMVGVAVSLFAAWWMSRSLDKLNKW